MLRAAYLITYIILRKNREEGYEKCYVPLHRGRGGRVKNCQNHSYIVNEWPCRLYVNVNREQLRDNRSVDAVVCIALIPKQHFKIFLGVWAMYLTVVIGEGGEEEGWFLKWPCGLRCSNSFSIILVLFLLSNIAHQLLQLYFVRTFLFLKFFL